MDSEIASRFPLIVRPRPAGRSLTERLAALAAFAPDPPEASHHDQVVRASGVINTASLIASDIGLHDLAETMCREHFAAFAAAGDLDAATAVMALQPLINIPRLMIRRGDGRGAYDALTRLYRAAQQRTTVEIGGGSADVAAVIRGTQQHHDVCRHLWATVLEDGLRALACAGEWQKAAEEAIAHKGVGPQLWSGRQAVILAHLQTGEAAQALAMVEMSTITSPAEHAVQALLYTFCALQGHLRPNRLAVARAEAHRLIALENPSDLYFRTQAALTALALAQLAHKPDQKLREAAIDAAAADAYAARAVITALGEQADRLRPIVEAGGLGQDAARSSDLAQTLTTHTDGAVTRLRRLLAVKTQRVEQHPAGPRTGAPPPSLTRS